jgi:hypothetical protein
MKVEIDHEILTEEKLHLINNFWSNGQYRLMYDTVLDAVLKMLCAEFMAQSSENFDPEAQFNNGAVEGFPPLDGSWGIRLVSYEPFVFAPELVDVEEY